MARRDIEARIRSKQARIAKLDSRIGALMTLRADLEDELGKLCEERVEGLSVDTIANELHGSELPGGCTDPHDDHAECTAPCGLVGCDPDARRGAEP